MSGYGSIQTIMLAAQLTSLKKSMCGQGTIAALTEKNDARLSGRKKWIGYSMENQIVKMIKEPIQYC